MLLVGFWLQAVHVQIDDRRCEEGKQLADDQSADDSDPQRPPELRSCAGAEGQRKGAKHRRQGGHDDRTEAQHAGMKDRVSGVYSATGYPFSSSDLRM